jgi:phosphohistidine phosphatase SixA
MPAGWAGILLLSAWLRAPAALYPPIGRLKSLKSTPSCRKEKGLRNKQNRQRERAMMKTLQIVCAVLLLLLGCSRLSAEDSRELVSALKQGGHVVVFRHGATDDSQKDIYPFDFGDMKAQRQLSEKGREMARQIGTAIKKLGIPVGEIYTSRLNRAIETGKLLSDKEVKPLDALTDSGAASASAMANPAGGNAKAGLALRELVNAAPKAGTNTFIVTHKTNIADAFGKEASDVQEGEAFVYRSSGSAPSAFVGRVKAAFWSDQAAN